MSDKEIDDVLEYNHRGPAFFEKDENKGELGPSESDAGLKLTNTGPLPRQQRTQRHCRAFWIYYFVGIVIFLAMFLPLFFVYVIPAVAQLVVNKSDLWVVDAEVLQPKPESVILTLKANIDLKLALPVRIVPLTLHLFEREYGPEDAYAALPIAGQTIRGNYTLGVDNHLTQVLNMTAWDKFVHQVVFQKDTTLSLKSTTDAYLGVLKSHVTLNKDVSTPTLNQFAGFYLSEATLILPPEPNGTNLIADITLPNPTVLTLQVGTLNMDIKSGNLVLGNATLNGVELKPGDNTFPLNGILDLKSIVKNLGDVLKMEANTLKNGNLTLSATPTSIIFDNTLIPYYTDVLRQLTLTTSIGIGGILKNTIRHLKDDKNFTGVISSLEGNSSDNRDLAIRSPDDRDGQIGSLELASFIKQNEHIQQVFEDEDPSTKDMTLDRLASLYSAL